MPVTFWAGGAGTATSNVTAIVDPTASSDSLAGYSVGSIWVNNATGTVWTCTDATEGAAVWVVSAQNEVATDYTSDAYGDNIATDYDYLPVVATVFST